MIQQIAKAVKDLKVDETRTAKEDYAELVFFSADMTQWQERIGTVMGPAVKPAGQKPTKDDETVTGSYGGIGLEQVLFRKDDGATAYIVMMWPWRDGTHVTLKVAKAGAAPAAAGAPAQKAVQAPQIARPGPDFMIIGVIAVLAIVAIATALYYWLL